MRRNWPLSAWSVRSGHFWEGQLGSHCRGQLSAWPRQCCMLWAPSLTSGAGLEPGTPWSPGHCLFWPMSGKKLQELLCTHVAPAPFSLLQKQNLGPLEILG